MFIGGNSNNCVRISEAPHPINTVIFQLNSGEIMSRIIVKADPKSNILYLTLNGIPTKGNVRQLKQVIKFELRKLQSGYKILNDARKMQPAVGDILEDMYDICQMIMDKQPSRIARLVNPYSRMLFSHLSSLMGFRAREFSSMELALNYLGVGFMMDAVYQNRQMSLVAIGAQYSEAAGGMNQR